LHFIYFIIMTQIEAAMPVTKTNSFILTINGCGGEHTMGTIKNEIAKYWQCEGEEFFEEYMFSWDKDEIANQYGIPEKYQLGDWNELDDLCHLNGPEFIEDITYFELIDIDTQESLSPTIGTTQSSDQSAVQAPLEALEGVPHYKRRRLHDSL